MKVLIFVLATLGLSLAFEHKEWSHHEFVHHHEEAPLDEKGHVIDTPEVAFAKIKHFQAIGEAIKNTVPFHHYRTADRTDDRAGKLEKK